LVQDVCVDSFPQRLDHPMGCLLDRFVDFSHQDESEPVEVFPVSDGFSFLQEDADSLTVDGLGCVHDVDEEAMADEELQIDAGSVVGENRRFADDDAMERFVGAGATQNVPRKKTDVSEVDEVRGEVLDFDFVGCFFHLGQK